MKRCRQSSKWAVAAIGLLWVAAGGCSRDSAVVTSVPRSTLSGTNSGNDAAVSAFLDNDVLAIADVAEMLAAYNLPAEAQNEIQILTAARLLLNQEAALRPIVELPSLLNADVAQPAGILNLSDVGLVLTALQSEGELTEASLAEQTNALVGTAERPFEARNVRVIPSVERLGDLGQPGGPAAPLGDCTEFCKEVIGEINGLPVSISSDGDMEFPAGTNFVFPGTPDPNRALTVSFDPPLLSSRNGIEVPPFTASDLGCDGTSCVLPEAVDVVPTNIEPAPEDYDITYVFRFGDETQGFQEVSALRVLSVLEPGVEPLPTPEPSPDMGAIVVTTPEDVVDADDGEVSLREAIIVANADPEPNEIELLAETYALALAGTDEDEAETGDLDIQGKLKIIGISAGETKIQGSPGDGSVQTDRVLHVLDGGDLTLESVEVSNGISTAGAGIYVSPNASAFLIESNVSGNEATSVTGSSGGGIYVGRNGSLTLEGSNINTNTALNSGGGVYGAANSILKLSKNSTISNNTATIKGGGIFGGSNSTIDVVDSSILGNFQSSESSFLSGSGGGLHSSGSVRLERSTISGNSAGRDGGGIFVDRFGTLDLEDKSIVSNNEVAYGSGGGIYGASSSTVNISDSTISGNSTMNTSERRVGGGGIRIDGTLDLLRSNVTDNISRTLDGGGGIYSGETDAVVNIMMSAISNNTATVGNGGGITNLGTTNLINSLVSYNSALDGGGILLSAGSTATLTNSTVASNYANDDGAGITFSNAELNVKNSTIANNTAGDNGGGIYSTNVSTTTVTIESSIIAGNFADDRYDNLRLQSSVSFNANNSLFESDADFIDSGENNVINVNPLLDPAGLQGREGFPQTIGLLENSPAIDAGSNPEGLTTDQRGELRVVDGDGDGTPVIDIGAFEFTP